MSNTIEIKVPDIGDVDEVDVIEVLVAENDQIEAEQSLITVESDKASMEIPAPQAGVVKSVSVKVGDKVAEGSVILLLEAVEGAESDADTPAAATASDALPLATLPPNTTVQILARFANFNFIITADGKAGWLPKAG